MLSARNSHGRCQGLGVRPTHRACSGSVVYLDVLLRQLSQISGADSAVSSTSVQVRELPRPSNRSLTYESAASDGYAHVEFASTEDAVRAVRQGVPHGFRYRKRLLDIDFARWVFYAGPKYRVVYISGWLTSDGGPELLRWAHDIPNIAGATVCMSRSSCLPSNTHTRADIVPYHE